MKGKKIAITGPRGQLGSELVKQGCIPLFQRLNTKALDYEIQELKPDVIINCAAYTDVDGCETNLCKAMETNTLGVSWLSQHFNGYLIQISTDYIFDGAKGPYEVTAMPNPLSVYGLSKLGGEMMTRRHQEPWLIIRIATPFGVHERPNLVSKVIKRLKERNELFFPEALISTPSYIPDLAQGIIEAATSEIKGILHIAGNRVMSLGDFARSIAEIWGLNGELIKMVDSLPVSSAAPRPLKGGLLVGTSMVNGIFINDPLDGLRKMYYYEYNK